MPKLTSKEDAINIMLAAIGETPINSLVGSKSVDVSMAENTLEEISRDIQTLGWVFNSDPGVTLVRDSEGRINLGDNVLQVEVSKVDYPDIGPVQRGSKLYDRKNHTSVFKKNIKAAVVYLLDWDDLPEAARRYINIKAARKFQDENVGSEKHHRFQERDEIEARALMKEHETETGDYTVFDSFDAARPLMRRSVL